MTNKKLSLFEGYGIELEYALVNSQTLAVLPIADVLLKQESGAYGDVERGPIAWSNETVLHVLELKTNGPKDSLDDLPAAFDRDIRYIHQALQDHQACLMPTGMHPFMNPLADTKLWPHDYNIVYETFDKIFNCRGHGWSNLQSMHINLPFANDDEFGALHAAIRLILPILPAIAASSPMIDGKLSGILDNRLQVYQTNAMRIPSVTGQVIPEHAYTRKDYEMNILARIYQDLAPHDPEGILQHEWVNARGAIARFDRNSIEIRVLDTQECPLADISIAALIVGVLKALVGQRWVRLEAQKVWPTKSLAALFRRAVQTGQDTVIDDEAYLRAFNFNHASTCTMQELWQHLVESIWPASAAHAKPWRAPIANILQQGTLAKRIVRALGRDTSKEHIVTIYKELCDCLLQGKIFKL